MYSNLRRNFVEVWRGDTFHRALKIEGYPLTLDTSIVMEVRAQTDFTPNLVLRFSTEDGSITIDLDEENEGGWITLRMPKESMLVSPGKHVYDCRFGQGDELYTLFHGLFIIHNNTTTL